MNDGLHGRRIDLTVGIGIVLLVLTLGLAFLLAKVESRTRRPVELPVYGPVADFTLTNQIGQLTTLADLRGRVWIADIIFTRCPGPCLRMTRQMKELEAALPPNSRIKLVTLTTDPDFDTAPVLTKYAERFNVDTNRWTFLTGTKPEIGNLATTSLKLAAVEKEAADRTSPEDLFIHSTVFVLVDKAGQLRGVYQTSGEDVDWAKSKQEILSAAKWLERAP